MIDVKTISVRKLRKAMLPIPNKRELDLISAFEDLKNTFDVKYDPATGIQGMHIKIGRASYLIYRTGTVMIMGNISLKKEREILTLVWKQHLKPHIIAKP